jgi:hypothetical protein
MINNKLIEIKRTSQDIGIFAKKNRGKTLTLSILAYLDQLNGTKIYSNYHLNFEHTYIDSIDKLDKIKQDKNSKKRFIGDDFERWFHSRKATSKSNLELNDILLDWGKIKCSCSYSAKRLMAIDLGLRDSTDEFWNIILEQYITHKDPKINRLMAKYINFLRIKIEKYDSDGNLIQTVYIKNLQNWIKLFDTTEIIKDLK